MKRRGKYFWAWALLLSGVILLLFSFLLGSVYSNNNSTASHAKYIERYINKAFENYTALMNDPAYVNKLLTSQETYNDIDYLRNEPFDIFIYKETPSQHFLKFWSTPLVLPDKNTLSGPNGQSFLKLPNGYYYVHKSQLKAHPDYRAYFLILIKHSFFIETENLQDEFPFNSGLSKMVDVSFAKTPYPVMVEGQPIFYLAEKHSTENATADSILSFVLKIVGLFSFFIGLYLFIRNYFALYDSLKEAFVFVLLMLICRGILFFCRDFMNYDQFELFDPVIYGSNYFLPSLGDLLINAIVFCWISVFLWNRLSTKKLWSLQHSTNSRKRIAGTVWILGFMLCTFIIINIARGLISYSKISFDVTNFFSLNIYTIVGFFILAALSLTYYNLSRIFFKVIFSAFPKKNFVVYIIIIVASFLYFLLFMKEIDLQYFLPSVMWLLVYTFVFHEEERINHIIKFNISGLVLWIFIFSISISLLMLDEIQKAELEQRKLYTEKLATFNDVASERLIDIGNRHLNNDFFANNYHRFLNEKENLILRDSIASRDYIGFSNKYQTSIYIFDTTGQALFNPEKNSYESLNNIVLRQSRQTSQPDLYYYETGADKYAYITQRTITDISKKVIGHVFIISNPKKFEAISFHPELFKGYNSSSIVNSPVYQYAIYNENVLVSSSKRYPFVTSLLSSQLPKYKFELRVNDGYKELWYRPNVGKVVVIARENQTFLQFITLFSYMFCSFLFIVALIQIISLIIESYSNPKIKRKIGFLPTIRGQIHGTFILITVLSFIVLGVATISFFISRYRNANNERLSRTMNVVMNELQADNDLSIIMDVLSKKDDSTIASYSLKLDSIIKSTSDIQGVDINIYDLGGRLRTTSQPDVYSKGVLSTQIGPRVFYNLLRARQIETVLTDRVSNLSYTSIYSPVIGKNGVPYAIIGIPFFLSEQELNQEISTFLVTLINLNAFVFLITGLVALIIANRVTYSFTLVGDKMKKISLSGNNEQIVWERDDEIGSLVKEYNKMVVKLSDSVNRLAREEREEAWREMARQVAHEIKNPLTPMKLSLQYLQKAINEDNPNVYKLAYNVSNNLVEQIDHLSKIAADFSQFADINKVDKQIFDLHDSLSSIVALYKTDYRSTLHWMPVEQELMVLADKTQMNRLFTNLITNAIDATAGQAEPSIEITEAVEAFHLLVTVKDNGSGIPAEMQRKIFQPNFTTKSSGTGLGLAMCKTIVERSGGTIWFDTEVGTGTRFHIRLPLIVS